MSTTVKTSNPADQQKAGKLLCYIQLGLSAVTVILSTVTLVTTMKQNKQSKS